MGSYHKSKFSSQKPIVIVSGKGNRRDSKDYGYEEVLEELSTSDVVRIISYSVVRDNERDLIKLLETNLTDNPNHDIKVILGIPSRYSFERNYKSSYAADIRQPLDNLTVFVKLGGRVSFNFKNHAKLIGTRSNLYIGSQNFTSWSRENFEMGVLLKNSNSINDVYEVHFESCWNSELVFDSSVSPDILKFKVSIQLLIEELKKSLASESPYSLSYEENKEILEKIIQELKGLGNVVPENRKEFHDLLGNIKSSYEKLKESDLDYNKLYNEIYDSNPYEVEEYLSSSTFADEVAKNETEASINDSISHFLSSQEPDIKSLFALRELREINKDMRDKLLEK